MATSPEVLQRLRNESPRPRVPRSNQLMIAVSLVVASVALFLVLGHRRPPALVVAYSRLLSPRTWRLLEAIWFLSIFAMTAIARAKRRKRT